LRRIKTTLSHHVICRVHRNTLANMAVCCKKADAAKRRPFLPVGFPKHMLIGRSNVQNLTIACHSHQHVSAVTSLISNRKMENFHPEPTKVKNIQHSVI
jgi:hypothetical protein